MKKEDRIMILKNTYKDVFTKEQIKWLVNYENSTGFEPIYDPEWGFQELVHENLQWFKNWSEEMIEKLEKHNRDLNKNYLSEEEKEIVLSMWNAGSCSMQCANFIKTSQETVRAFLFERGLLDKI